jgi:hypothetical protein
MINSQEIIERSLYDAILQVAIRLNYSLDPNEYLPITPESVERCKRDKDRLDKYIAIYSTGNATSKDQKETPRIVLNARGFFPGSIGLPKSLVEKKVGIGYTAFETPYETIDQYIDVHLVASNQEDLRILHQILFFSLPAMGYIKPYNIKEMPSNGNIFIELGNFFDTPNNNLGLLEKVYEFRVYDTLVGLNDNVQTDLPEIISIEAIINNTVDLEVHK